MSPDSPSSEIETALRRLPATALDPAYLARLEAAADGSLTTLTPMEIRFEDSLRDQTPCALSADFMLRLESLVAGVPFAVDEKIVSFPIGTATLGKSKVGSRFSAWSAAAAVALIGASTALFIPGRPGKSPVAENNPISRPAAPSDPSNYAAAGFNRGPGKTTDEGVTWPRADKPLRVLRLNYVDRITLKNPEGKVIEVEQPRTEYIFVPEKMD